MQVFECKQTAGKFEASCEKNSNEFFKYFDILDPPAKKRYCEKLKVVDDIDLCAIEDENFTYDINCFPAITYLNIVNYLVFGTSPFSAEDVKAYKSLDAYNQVMKGWVIDVKTLMTKSDLNIVRGKVTLLHYSILFDDFS